ncbi:4-hydroxy-tetrahydrodipicolinate synthase [Phytophthora citrophthora]|uniref:4-hydroxy-tetrahydrodipicolinate synthase n=1 Tax=Phytophthora citrophthora TaxID=4793 RepID=A0AAD9GI55_9STRA|nr:4-hydroxy-tetrahydrodipicolinate synthase [Phytophthora citrophthora]
MVNGDLLCCGEMMANSCMTLASDAVEKLTQTDRLQGGADQMEVSVVFTSPMFKHLLQRTLAVRLGAHNSIGVLPTRSMTSTLRFDGTYTALVTPFTPDDSSVDYECLEKMVEWQIQQGIDSLVPMGSTGENTLVSDEERLQVIKTVLKRVNGRVPDTTDSVAHAVDIMALCDLPVVCGADNLANPMLIKKAMELLGHCSSTVRSPLTDCSAKTEKLLQEQLKVNKLL